MAPRLIGKPLAKPDAEPLAFGLRPEMTVGQRGRDALGAPTTYRILIVDDDEDARILLMRALAKSALNVEILTAGDGRQALELLAHAQPHALITDIMMPRMDGFHLCAAVRKDPAMAGIPVIVLTALENERDRQRGLAAGADSYFTKPFNWRALTDRLAELLESTYGAEARSRA